MNFRTKINDFRGFPAASGWQQVSAWAEVDGGSWPVQSGPVLWVVTTAGGYGGLARGGRTEGSCGEREERLRKKREKMGSSNMENLLQNDLSPADNDGSPEETDQLSPYYQNQDEEIEPFYEILSASAPIPHQSLVEEVIQKELILHISFHKGITVANLEYNMKQILKPKGNTQSIIIYLSADY
ncbi:unnamed protein product [Prunus armeniaca]